MAAQQRPLSPHLSIYSRQLTMMMSIIHRATGVLLGVAAFAVLMWLWSVAAGSASVAVLKHRAGSTVGIIALLAVTASLVYHLLNGIRHLLWDIGWGFDLPQAYASGWTVVALTLVVTALLAVLGLHAGGLA